MYLHKTKNENYTPPCCYFSGELEVVESIWHYGSRKGIVLTIDWYLEHEDWMNNVTSGNYQKYYEAMYKAKAEI